MEHQLAGAQLMVADQGPQVQAEARVRQGEVVATPAGLALDAAAEVVAQVADQPAGEGQFQAVRRFGLAEARQCGTKTDEEVFGRFAFARRQFLHRPGAEQIEAATLGARPAGVEQHGARRFADRGETGGGRFVVGNRVYGAVGHEGEASRR
ncbi:hypothetical protein D9M71_358560 [compost metagenome]